MLLLLDNFEHGEAIATALMSLDVYQTTGHRSVRCTRLP